MTTRIRLRRMGSNKRPFYRVVVADQRSPRDGRFIEIIGRYHPLNDPSVIEIDENRALHWLMVGAQPSNQVRNLMTKVGIWERFAAQRPSGAAAIAPKPDRPVRPKLSKKAQAKAAESAEASEHPADALAPEPESSARPQEAEGSSPDVEPARTDTEVPARAASTDPDEVPPTDTTGSDVQETPEG
ncbi:MAG: 30S ribosomal protein S16 [Actinobacteria bacterium]|nr:MAG: 30S ribosomal protein S16 [Actinomycetota bacterium]